MNAFVIVGYAMDARLSDNLQGRAHRQRLDSLCQTMK
jgi:hypothetical protein